MSKIIGAVEIGTSSAKALVGEVGETGALSIVGMATRQNEGMRKGEIMDFDPNSTQQQKVINNNKNYQNSKQLFFPRKLRC